MLELNSQLKTTFHKQWCKLIEPMEFDLLYSRLITYLLHSASSRQTDQKSVCAHSKPLAVCSDVVMWLEKSNVWHRGHKTFQMAMHCLFLFLQFFPIYSQRDALPRLFQPNPQLSKTVTLSCQRRGFHTSWLQSIYKVGRSLLYERFLLFPVTDYSPLSQKCADFG